jgi:L-asparaginase II
VTALLAEVTRGGVVESTHEGTIIVVNAAGETLAAVGDPTQFAFFRSSAKPFQAIPVIESGAADRFGFTPAELALCCASHHAEQRHLDQVVAMLAKLGLDESALQCGIPHAYFGDLAVTPLQCDCSGKHTGMLASCLQLGFPIDSYLEPDHPLQVMIRGLVAEVCRVAPEDLALATDGCSVPTFGTSVAAFALSYAALAAPEAVPSGAGREHAVALNRLREAMMAFPFNVSGTDGLVTDLMEVGKGEIVAKSGAEGLICLGVPKHQIGIAIRVADGSFRAHPAIVAAVLRQLKLVDECVIDALLARQPLALKNHNGRHVGDIRAAFDLTA